MPRVESVRKKPVKGSCNVKSNSRVPPVKRPSGNFSRGRPRKKSNEGDKDQHCVICLDTRTLMEEDKIACGHTFHKICINRWLADNNSCPICRMPVNIRQQDVCPRPQPPTGELQHIYFLSPPRPDELHLQEMRPPLLRINLNRQQTLRPQQPQVTSEQQQTLRPQQPQVTSEQQQTLFPQQPQMSRGLPRPFLQPPHMSQEPQGIGYTFRIQAEELRREQQFSRVQHPLEQPSHPQLHQPTLSLEEQLQLHRQVLEDLLQVSNELLKHQRQLQEDQRQLQEDQRQLQEDRRQLQEDRRQLQEDRRKVREERQQLREERRQLQVQHIFL